MDVVVGGFGELKCTQVRVHRVKNDLFERLGAEGILRKTSDLR